MNHKPVIHMHLVMPGRTGGPNVCADRIMHSRLSEKYSFVTLNQNRVAGGTVNAGLIRELRDQIKAVAPDIVHVSGLQSAGFHCAIAAKLAGCKAIVVTIHGFSGSTVGLHPVKRWVFNAVAEPATLRIAHRVHSISHFTAAREMVRKHAAHKVTVIHNLPAPEPHNPQYGDIRQELGIARDDIVVSTVGRIIIDKGHRELAESIKLLHDLPRLRFLVVGDGKYEDEFRQRLRSEIAQGRVIMLGKRSDVMDILHGGDIFALPTLHENFGNVFVEASQARNAVIGTNVGGIPEIVIDKETGLLIPAGDADALASAIRELYNSPDVRERLGRQAHERCNTIFSSDALLPRFDDLYTSMLA